MLSSTVQEFQRWLLPAAFLVLWLAESWRPHHARAGRWWRHTAANLFLTLLYVVAGIAFSKGNAVATEWTQTNAFGVLYWLSAPAAVAIVLGVLVLDLVAYGGHILKHKWPILWRFHQVHHSDADLDVTTGFRFHPVEALISWLFLIPAIFVFGVPILAILIFAGLYSLSALAQHANFALPEWVDRMVRVVFVSPGSHRIHHSPHVERTDSNYASLFSFWDRLFGTYKTPRRHAETEFGLRDEWGKESLRELLVEPFAANGPRLKASEPADRNAGVT